MAPSIKSDLYSIGGVLYFLSFYNPTNYKLTMTDIDFFNIMEAFEISPTELQDYDAKLKARYTNDFK